MTSLQISTYRGTEDDRVSTFEYAFMLNYSDIYGVDQAVCPHLDWFKPRIRPKGQISTSDPMSFILEWKVPYTEFGSPFHCQGDGHKRGAVEPSITEQILLPSA
ncbi:hypothetical protein FRC14_006534 [Serendipita sp. 396]|nr:hypothetical protein FRC14_006534 [Serendipita sp. 396]KAG8778534.1 hypothetical protein FRC15_010743 [Serendipita sp. 397]KAG8829210.1 hypothetical protein FRC18_009460 [Serendipita sp. 400]